jgi:hypothetical protein
MPDACKECTEIIMGFHPQASPLSRVVGTLGTWEMYPNIVMGMFWGCFGYGALINKYRGRGDMPSPAHAELPWSNGMNMIPVESLRLYSLNDLLGAFPLISGINPGSNPGLTGHRTKPALCFSRLRQWPSPGRGDGPLISLLTSSRGIAECRDQFRSLISRFKLDLQNRTGGIVLPSTPRNEIGSLDCQYLYTDTERKIL